MELTPLRSELVTPGVSLAEEILSSLKRARVGIQNRDIMAVASKAVAIAEDRVVELNRVEASQEARRLARRHGMPAQVVQVVLDEADEVYGGVTGTLLTLKNGDAVANSGVDQKNAPAGSVVLWPLDPALSARKLSNTLRRKLGKRVGVVIVDSRVTPLRLGTTGMALACSGFRPTRDFRGKRDLFGRKSRITVQSSADGVAAAAQLLMGEGKERVPFVLVRGAPVDFDGSWPIPKLSRDECLYMSCLAKNRN